MSMSKVVEQVTTVKFSKSDIEAALASHAGLPTGTVIIKTTTLEDGYTHAIVEDRVQDWVLGMRASDALKSNRALQFQDTVLSQLDQQVREKGNYSLTAERAADLIRALRQQISELKPGA